MPRIVGLISLVLVVCASASARAQPRTLTLAEAIQTALEGNLELQQMGEDVAAARARVVGARALFKDNPTVSLNLGPRVDTTGTSLDYSVQVLQPIEIGGQRAARIAAASAGVAAEQAELDVMRNLIAALVREQFIKALAAAERLRLADEALALARDGAATADERARAGAGAALEINSARVELGRAARARGQAEAARLAAVSELRLVMGLDPTVDVVPQGELAAPAPTPGDSTIEVLLDEALARRAETRQLRLMLEAAQADVRVTDRERLPVPRFGVSYTRESGSDTSIVQGVFALDLPFFHRNRAARGVAAARVRQLRLAQTAVEREIRERARTALARVRAAETAASEFDAAVVKAMTDNLELVTEAHRAGRIDFLQLITIRRQALDARREYIDLLEELNAARAALDLALGRAATAP